MASEELNTLLMRVARRAENSSESVLQEAFVSIPALVTQLDTGEHQVLFGRRGTGKTHLLRHLQMVQEERGALVVYLDLRKIGSPEDLRSADQKDFAEKATELLIDLVEHVHTAVYEQVLEENWSDRLSELSLGLDALADAATQVRVVGDTEVEQSRETTTAVDRSSGGQLSLSRSPGVSWKNEKRSEQARRSGERKLSRGRESHHVLLGPLCNAIQRIARVIEPHQLWLLIDEWSALPLDLQPLMADLLRRTFCASAGVVVKISAIHGRTRFSEPAPGGGLVGLELGADTAATLDLDDFLLFRNDATRTVDFYAAMLFKHLRALTQKVGHHVPPVVDVATPAALMRMVFAHPDGFHELILGAEGVPRDALQIAGLAAGAAFDRPISSTHVAQATRDFFLRDKQDRLPRGQPQRVFSSLVDQCTKQRSRIIPLRRVGESDDEIIRRLYDARLIHRVRQGVSIDPQRPTVVYDIYVIDYGCFLGLLRDGRIHSLQDGLDPGARFAKLDEIEIRGRSFTVKPHGWYRQPVR